MCDWSNNALNLFYFEWQETILINFNHTYFNLPNSGNFSHILFSIRICKYIIANFVLSRRNFYAKKSGVKILKKSKYLIPNTWIKLYNKFNIDYIWKSIYFKKYRGNTLYKINTVYGKRRINFFFFLGKNFIKKKMYRVKTL